MRLAAFAAVALAALVAASSALGACAKPKVSLTKLEGEVMCPICHTTLDQSDSLAAQQIEQFISVRIARCESEAQIKDELVRNYGTVILAAPPRRGFDLLAWWLPLGGIVAAAVLVGFGAWRWRRARAAEGEPDEELDPDTERRLDDLLAHYE